MSGRLLWSALGKMKTRELVYSPCNNGYPSGKGSWTVCSFRYTCVLMVKYTQKEVKHVYQLRNWNFREVNMIQIIVIIVTLRHCVRVHIFTIHVCVYPSLVSLLQCLCSTFDKFRGIPPLYVYLPVKHVLNITRIRGCKYFIWNMKLEEQAGY